MMYLFDIQLIEKEKKFNFHFSIFVIRNSKLKTFDFRLPTFDF